MPLRQFIVQHAVQPMRHEDLAHALGHLGQRLLHCAQRLRIGVRLGHVRGLPCGGREPGGQFGVPVVLAAQVVDGQAIGHGKEPGAGVVRRGRHAGAPSAGRVMLGHAQPGVLGQVSRGFVIAGASAQEAQQVAVGRGELVKPDGVGGGRWGLHRQLPPRSSVGDFGVSPISDTADGGPPAWCRSTGLRGVRWPASRSLGPALPQPQGHCSAACFARRLAARDWCGGMRCRVFKGAGARQGAGVPALGLLTIRRNPIM